MSEKRLEPNYIIQLNSWDEIIDFVSEMDKCKDNIYAIGEHTFADAKSIIGMTALGIGEEFYLAKTKSCK